MNGVDDDDETGANLWVSDSDVESANHALRERVLRYP